MASRIATVATTTAAALALTAAAAVYLCSGDDDAEAIAPLPAAAPQAGSARPAPPALAALPPNTRHRPPPQDRDPEQPLAADERGDLLVNSGLLDTFDYYLLQQAGEGDEDDLKAFLKQRLPQRANIQALQLLDRYKIYMKQHDDDLGIQGLVLQPGIPPDLGRLRLWIEQRDRLRQGILGPAVTQAWFENDDTRLRRAVDELQQRGLDPRLSPSNEPGRPVPHWQNPADETRHVQELLGRLGAALTRFDARKRRTQAPPS